MGLEGQQFGRWTAIEQTRSQNGHFWLCKCQCGTMREVRAGGLRSGKSKSCGCLSRQTAGDKARSHGSSQSREYIVWSHMRSRCTNPRSQDFPRYGGRGIKVCDRWELFELFLEDMGPRPSPQHSIDRINNNGNYEPSNCRWATIKEQANNTRTNRPLTFRGKTQTVAQWAVELGVKPATLRYRLKYGWSTEECLLGRRTRTNGERFLEFKVVEAALLFFDTEREATDWTGAANLSNACYALRAFRERGK